MAMVYEIAMCIVQTPKEREWPMTDVVDGNLQPRDLALSNRNVADG